MTHLLRRGRMVAAARPQFKQPRRNRRGQDAAIHRDPDAERSGWNSSKYAASVGVMSDGNHRCGRPEPRWNSGFGPVGWGDGGDRRTGARPATQCRSASRDWRCPAIFARRLLARTPGGRANRNGLEGRDGDRRSLSAADRSRAANFPLVGTGKCTAGSLEANAIR